MEHPALQVNFTQDLLSHGEILIGSALDPHQPIGPLLWRLGTIEGSETIVVLSEGVILSDRNPLTSHRRDR